MIELRRVTVVDWYLFRVEQFDLRGMTALIGPNGSGKSALIDAVQTALTGGSMASNRLDTAAICTCSDFLKDLGLQVVLAAPDEKRHVFMEVVDTVINVNRSKNDVLVDVEYLTEKTRQALGDADPYRKGFEAFKSNAIAAGQAIQQAAE